MNNKIDVKELRICTHEITTEIDILELKNKIEGLCALEHDQLSLLYDEMNYVNNIINNLLNDKKQRRKNT